MVHSDGWGDNYNLDVDPLELIQIPAYPNKQSVMLL